MEAKEGGGDWSNESCGCACPYLGGDCSSALWLAEGGEGDLTGGAGNHKPDGSEQAGRTSGGLQGLLRILRLDSHAQDHPARGWRVSILPDQDSAGSLWQVVPSSSSSDDDTPSSDGLAEDDDDDWDVLSKYADLLDSNEATPAELELEKLTQVTWTSVHVWGRGARERKGRGKDRIGSWEELLLQEEEEERRKISYILQLAGSR
eukprot:768774-Hanusia_phi.AAC.2